MTALNRDDWWCFNREIPFYRVITRWKVGGQGERGSDSETLVAPVLRDGNEEWEAMGCGHFWRGKGGGGDTAPRCQRQMIVKIGTTVREAKGSGWCLDVEDDQRKLGQ
jgi:hypothetical protein